MAFDKIKTIGGKIGKKKFYQLNQYIKAEELRVVDQDGGQVGVLKKQEALNRAREAGLDLVVVAEKAKPPVAKIVEFAKFKYQQQQKEAAGRKKAKTVDIKEVRFTPFIAEGDYNQRIKKARKFLEGRDKVRLTVKFVGRQITRKEFGKNLLEKAVAELEDIAKVEFAPRLQGKLYFTQLQPTGKVNKNEEK
ncbi:translation initiation factor IF-3 [Patescibacteria group bacterium]